MRLETLEREPAMAPCGAGGERHGHEDDLADLLVRHACLHSALGVRVDAPGALGDVRDTERDQLLGLDRQRSGREGLRVEVEERPVGVRCQLPHPLELPRHIDAMELHTLAPFFRCGLLYTSPDAVAARPSRFYSRRVMRAIAVHGGAGRETPADRGARRAGLARAEATGWAVLARGGGALDAVVEAVAVLENDPCFNAGLGSVLTVEGDVEMDASVMTGDTLVAGAVGAVSSVANPVRLARAVAAEGREVFLVGDAAVALAARHGLSTCAPGALITDGARRRWRERRPAPGETVGAVACDANGHVAAATSTGGVAGKRRGRIGDSAVIGAGTYADDELGAGSATGPGEAIIRATMVRAALELIGRGLDPGWVARYALVELDRRVGATAGLILVDPRGRIGIAHTTRSMPAAWRTDDHGPEVVGA